jgi:sulfide:quinone oxidoreductase
MSITSPTPTDGRAAKPTRVVIAGGGVAALETALALRALAADRVALELVAPSRQFVYRPMGVLAPFVGSPPRALDLSAFAAEIGAGLRLGSLRAVDPGRRVARTADGHELAYDALVIATGARWTAPRGVTAVDVGDVAGSMGELLAAIDAGRIGSVAFLLRAPTWPLPAYEIALLLRQRALDAKVPLSVTVVSDESRPLEVFGEAVTEAAERLLSGAEVGFVSAPGASPDGTDLVLEQGRKRLPFDRVAALPTLAGPEIDGLVLDAAGFLPVGPNGELGGLGGVYAAGDATSFPVKFGAIATHQADAVAAAIASGAGVAVSLEPPELVVDGILLAGAGSERVYFQTVFEGGRAVRSKTSATPTGGLDAKIAARHLGRYLDERWAAGPRWLAQELSWETTLSRLERQFATR